MLTTKDKHQLKLLGLKDVFSNSLELHDIFDCALKVLLEEKYVVMTTKLSICTFIEEQTSLLNSVTDAELIFATLKNLFESCVEDDDILLQGKCLSTMTTVLVQTITVFQGSEVFGLFSEVLNFLMVLVKQVNNVKNSHVRSVAANCLLELELCFPALLKPYVDTLYTATVTETTTAHQQYLCLLALTIKNFLCYESSARLDILPPTIREQLPSAMAWPETAVPDVSFSNINQVLSFMVDQVPLCTSEAITWVVEQLAPLLKSVPSCLPLLQPLILTATRTHYLPLVHIVHLLQRDIGETLTSNQDQSHSLSLLSLNASATCLPVAHRLIALDILADCLAAIPSAVNPVGQAAAVTVLLPASFDGPETQLKKIIALASVLHTRDGAAAVIVPVIESVRQEILCRSSTRLKSILVKAIFLCWSDLHLCDLNSKIPNLVASVVEDDATFIPFALSLEEKMRDRRPESAVPRELLSLLVQVTTQPAPGAVHMEDTTLGHLVSVFWAALRQSEKGMEWVKTILLYLMKHIVNQENCSALSWSSGHEILSLCYFLMMEYDPAEVYFELCEVLRSIIAWSTDIDLQDRAQIYYAIMASHSAKKLNVPKQISLGADECEESFKPTSVFKKLEKPILRLSKCGTKIQSNLFAMEIKDMSEKEIAQEYYSSIKNVRSQACIVLNCSLAFTQECGRNIQSLDGLALRFSVPETWGHIETTMVGHINKKNFREFRDIYQIEVVCFPCKPYPITGEVRAEFAVGEVCHVCSLDSFPIEFVDFFECLPVQDSDPAVKSTFQERLYSALWSELKASCCESVTILYAPKEKILKELEERLGPFIIHSKSDGSHYHVGIYLPPQYHLLAEFHICDEKSAVTFLTEEAYIMALAGNFFEQWGLC
ncbi:AP-5 complex subunit beta-1-like isoform X1 [Schistocerca serialis cubense]|uniref:AP-5 complex subunit beta-1-like isoform X1 n=1 Tax=Schistocerca serialis cubense TaxID=2023355 RepID=UPI00214EFB40|nr:AP-5 complex subunit beta-1-like isoform X1 [Schistocerca serialis cubense]